MATPRGPQRYTSPLPLAISPTPCFLGRKNPHAVRPSNCLYIGIGAEVGVGIAFFDLVEHNAE